MDLILTLMLSIFGYLISSISFTRIIGELVLPGEDLERTRIEVEGTDEPFNFTSVSATTIRTKAGARYGIITGLLDMLKAAIPIAVVLNLYQTQEYAYFLSTFIIIGHDFPIYYKFRGGRGVSCLIGSLIFFDWISIPIALGLSMVIGLFVIDDDFIAYLAMPAYLIPWTLLTTGVSWLSAYAVVINIIYWVSLTPEIREYMKFRRTDAYEKVKKARHERTKKRISTILNKLRVKRK